MAPQLEDGFTRIANELIDQFAKHRFAGQEWQILWVVLRKTYGFGRKEDRISYGQFSEATGIPRRKVIELVKGLVSKRALGSVHNGTREIPTYWINKKYGEWSPSVHKGTSAHKDTTPSAHIDTFPSAHIGTHKRKKERIKEKTPLPPLPEWINVEAWESFRQHRIELKKRMTPRAEELTIKHLEKLEKEGNPHVEVINQSIRNGYQGVFELKKAGKPKPAQADDHYYDNYKRL